MNSQVLKYVAAVIAIVAIFVSGYQYAAALYGEEIAALREDYATRACALEEKYREKERVQYQSLVEAWEARDTALARIERLSGDVDRVRREAADAKRRLSATSSGTCDAERKRLARGAEIVERGSVLLERCVDLAERSSINKDTMAKIVSP